MISSPWAQEGRPMERARLEAVFLDAGGVLIDESARERSMGEAVAAELARTVPGYAAEDYRADIDEAVACFCPRAYHYVLWKHWRSDLDPFEARCEAFFESWRASAPPLELMPGIGEELRRLAGRFRVGIAGQYGRSVLELLDEHGLGDTLSWRFTQDDFVGITKPDPRYLERILARCGVEPGAAVMVGDRIDKDVVPARMVGMRTVLVRVGLHRNQQPRLPEEVPDVELPSVVGLAAAIEELADRPVPSDG
jgi:HAD superfamily hydrolase (TIGR01549 family)